MHILHSNCPPDGGDCDSQKPHCCCCAALGFHGECMRGDAALWMSAELEVVVVVVVGCRVKGGPEAAAAAGGVALTEIVIIAVSKLRSFL